MSAKMGKYLDLTKKMKNIDNSCRKNSIKWLRFSRISRTLTLRTIFSDVIVSRLLMGKDRENAVVANSEMQAGYEAGQKIFSQEGIVLLGENMELTERLISRLDQCGIQYVYITDPKTDDIVLPSLIREETMQIALKEIRTNFREMMDRPKRKKGVTYPYIAQPFKNMMNMIIDDLSGHQDAMIMLMDMSSVDHYLFQHSLNVCVYTTLLGMSNGYSKDELTTLGMGALLHDIGKTQIAIDVLRKPGSLSKEEFEAMKQHARIGYELLKDEPNLPLLVAHCAFQHHERIDGSGYPRGIKGNEIHDYAKWIGLVDSYDAMTTNRVYSAPMLPHHAIERLYAVRERYTSSECCSCSAIRLLFTRLE